MIYLPKGNFEYKLIPYFTMKANNMNPDQTATLDPYCLQYKLHVLHEHQLTKQTTFVMSCEKKG